MSFASIPKEHLLAFNSWRAMLERCLMPTHNQFRYYGGRGVRVCERWMDFRAFIEDMGPRLPGLTLDRIDCHGNYEPGNCRWATAHEQSRNRRGNIWIGNELQADIARKAGLDDTTIARRLRRGDSGEALLRPSTGCRRRITDLQEIEFQALHESGKNFTEIGRLYGISRETVRLAVRRRA